MHMRECEVRLKAHTRPKRHKARGFVVGQVVHDSALGQLGVRIRALARAYGL